MGREHWRIGVRCTMQLIPAISITRLLACYCMNAVCLSPTRTPRKAYIFRDVGRCCKERRRCRQKQFNADARDVPVAISAHFSEFSVQVTCISVWLCCIGSLLRAASRDEVCVVLSVNSITQVTLHGFNFLILSKCKYFHAKIDSLANVKSSVAVGPIS